MNLVTCLSQYTMNPETGLFKHYRDHSLKERKWLSAFKEAKFASPLATDSSSLTYEV